MTVTVASRAAAQAKTADQAAFDTFYVTRAEHLSLAAKTPQYLGPLVGFQRLLREQLFGVEYWNDFMSAQVVSCKLLHACVLSY